MAVALGGGTVNLDDLAGRATLTVEEAAGLLGVSRGVAYESVRSGELPSLHLGRRVLVPVPQLMAMLRAGDSAMSPGGPPPK